MEDELQQAAEATAPAADPDLSTLLVTLLKGVIYREGDERMWSSLLGLQARVREYVAVIGLEVVLDEAEGYTFLKSRPVEAGEQIQPGVPRLVARRALSFPVSLLLALLRKKLAEFDAAGGDTRLVLTRDDVVDLVRVFLPDSSNEAKIVDQIDAHLNKVVEMGFLRPMKGVSGPAGFEVRRILKAFVDAQWLSEFDARLAAYQVQLAGDTLQRAGTADE